MGLDGVELLIETEDVFGIAVADDEAEALATPRQVIDLIYRKLKPSEAAVCQSQRAFYLLRNALAGVLGLQRRRLSPRTPIRELLPHEDVRAPWHGVQRTLGARVWPQLSRPAWLRAVLVMNVLLILILVFTVVHATAPGGTLGWSLLAAVASALLAAVLLAWLTQSFQRRVPDALRELADLIPFVVTSPGIPWTRADIAAKFREITLKQLGIKPEIYDEDAHFVKDLGLG